MEVRQRAFMPPAVASKAAATAVSAGPAALSSIAAVTKSTSTASSIRAFPPPTFTSGMPTVATPTVATPTVSTPTVFTPTVLTPTVPTQAVSTPKISATGTPWVGAWARAAGAFVPPTSLPHSPAGPTAACSVRQGAVKNLPAVAPCTACTATVAEAAVTAVAEATRACTVTTEVLVKCAVFRQAGPFYRAASPVRACRARGTVTGRDETVTKVAGAFVTVGCAVPREVHAVPCQTCAVPQAVCAFLGIWCTVTEPGCTVSKPASPFTTVASRPAHKLTRAARKVP
mmetsp:Transcript_30582/g.51683  ORF Transcript_30582/g.51683 Transcript_30582/m.51683 type:complete len:286 (-) Transcript_30582:1726-2583(-)